MAWRRSSPHARYADGRGRTIAIVFCGEIFWLLLIGVMHLHSAADKGFLALMALLMVVVAIRSGFSYVLILEPQRVKARTLARTRSWTYRELDSARRTVASSSSNRGSIVLCPKNGKPYRFVIRSESPTPPSLADHVVDEINFRILCASHAEGPTMPREVRA